MVRSARKAQGRAAASGGRSRGGPSAASGRRPAMGAVGGCRASGWRRRVRIGSNLANVGPNSADAVVGELRWHERRYECARLVQADGEGARICGSARLIFVLRIHHVVKAVTLPPSAGRGAPAAVRSETMLREHVRVAAGCWQSSQRVQDPMARSMPRARAPEASSKTALRSLLPPSSLCSPPRLVRRNECHPAWRLWRR